MGVLCKLLTYAVIIMKSILVYSFNCTRNLTHIISTSTCSRTRKRSSTSTYSCTRIRTSTSTWSGSRRCIQKNAYTNYNIGKSFTHCKCSNTRDCSNTRKRYYTHKRY